MDFHVKKFVRRRCAANCAVAGIRGLCIRTQRIDPLIVHKNEIDVLHRMKRELLRESRSTIGHFLRFTKLELFSDLSAGEEREMIPEVREHGFTSMATDCVASTRRRKRCFGTYLSVQPSWIWSTSQVTAGSQIMN